MPSPKSPYARVPILFELVDTNGILTQLSALGITVPRKERSSLDLGGSSQMLASNGGTLPPIAMIDHQVHVGYAQG